MVHIIVEGNIGVGKTSLLEGLEKTYGTGLKIFTEPIKKLQCYWGENLLQLMYNDPKRWAFTFQTAISMQMMKMHEEVSKIHDVHTISERSIFGTKVVFLEHLKKQGLLTKSEAHLLEDTFELYVTKWKITPDVIIYLQASPETCLKRIQERGRAEEKKITLDYIKGLHDLHQRWLHPSCNHCHNDLSTGGKKVIVIDANQLKKEILAAVCAQLESVFAGQ